MRPVVLWKMIPLLLLLLLATQLPAATAAPLAAVNGVLSVPTSVAINPGTIVVTVIDADHAGGAIPATATTIVKNGVVCAATNIPLVETPLNSGVFQSAPINFTGLCGGTGGGSQLRIEYTDPTPNTANFKDTRLVNVTSVSGTLSAPSSIPLGGLLTVTVTDADKNLNNGAQETITGRVTIKKNNCPACSSATIDVRESGNNTGIFRNDVAPLTPFDPATLGLVAGDVMLVTYNDEDPTTNKPTALVTIAATSGTISAPANVGINPGTVEITVTDADLAGGALGAGVVTAVKDGCGACTPQNVPAFTETPVNSGIFKHTYNFAPLGLVAGDRLRLTYNDANPNSNKPFVLVNITSASGTMTVAPTSVFVGQAVTINVTDSDVPNTPANIVVKAIIDGCGACTATTIAMTNTGVGTYQNNTFVPSSIGAVAGQNVRITYEDLDPVSNRPSVLIAVRSNEGVLTAPSQVLVTSPVFTITVNDAQLNTNAASKQQIDNLAPNPPIVRIYNCNPACNPANFDAITLIETDNNTGIFTASVNLATAGGAPLIPLAAGNTFFVRYEDDDPNTNTPEIQVTLVASISDATLAVSPSIVAPAGAFTATVVDNDRKGAGQVQVTVQNITKNTAAQNVQLNESATQGTFSASINVSNFGLNAANGDTVRVTYIDTSPSDGSSQKVITRDVQVLTLTFGTDATLTVTNTIPGRPVQVTLFDPDLGNTAAPSVTVQNITINGTTETLRPGFSGTNNTFVGSQTTAYGTTPDGAVDGIVEAKGGDIIRFTYVDTVNSTGFSRTITADALVVSRRSTALFCDQGTETSRPAWRAEYFPNKDLAGDVAVIAQEVDLNVSWEETAPFRQLPADGWSARWTTTVNFTRAAKYRFRVGADDGMRFYIDDVLWVDDWVAAPFGTVNIDVAMTEGPHTFRVEMFEDTGQAGLLVDCLFLETPVAAIDPAKTTSTGFHVDFLFPSDVAFDEAVAHIATGNLNVRANPVVTAAKIAVVNLYRRYPILGVTDDNGWYLIDLGDGRTGWVATRYVYRAEDTPVQIYPSWVSTEAQLPNVEVAGYATEELKLRTQPRTGADIGRVAPNVGFRVLARTQSGAWYRIQYEGLEGWVFAPFVVLTNGTVQDLPRE